MSLLDLARAWLAVDPNADLRRRVEELVAANDLALLASLMEPRIAFGTAGLRARMEPGFARMNDVTVLQASQGLAEYIKTHTPGGTVVVGHDHRHHSQRFAELAATAFLLRGFTVVYLGGERGSSACDLVVATPLVPFAIDTHGAAGGVMVTASHNPAADNGYKVYWGNGCQIIPPHDHGIAALIEAHLEPSSRAWDVEQVFAEGRASGKLVMARSSTIAAYTRAVETALVRGRVLPALRFVYTPMHGVGWGFVEAMCQALGADVHTVASQLHPDPDFPTVQFPNPEEKGALAQATAEADRVGADLVVANDPDADRFLAAVRTAAGWRQLTGNELGFLFADDVVRRMERGSAPVYLLNLTVLLQMIRRVCEVEGLHYQDTLTGFKWIGNRAIELEAEGAVVPFAYEEAIGFMFPVVHDKDGILAAVQFLQMASGWQAEGTLAVERLEEGFAKYGHFKEHNGYYIVPLPSTTTEIFTNEIRLAEGYPQAYPRRVGDYTVTAWRDLTVGFDLEGPGGVPLLPTDPLLQMVTCVVEPAGGRADERVRFTARGSGTEPKLKVYIEGVAASGPRAEELARDVWETLRRCWFKVEQYGLVERC